MELLLLFVGVGILLYFVLRMDNAQGSKAPVPSGYHNASGQSLEDAIADARHWVDRLGGQVLQLNGTDTASQQALADASERFNAASAQISTANTVRQAQLAREAALEGLYYIQAARDIMGMPKGPELPPLEGQQRAGAVSEQRTVEVEGQTLSASPTASSATPNYYPGGMVAGRPVPAGWYSEPWWKGALRTGMWTAGSVMLFSTLFGGMAGAAHAADFHDYDAGGDFGGDGFDGGFGGDGFDGGFGGDGFDGGFGDFGDFGDFGGFDF